MGLALPFSEFLRFLNGAFYEEVYFRLVVVWTHHCSGPGNGADQLFDRQI